LRFKNGIAAGAKGFCDWKNGIAVGAAWFGAKKLKGEVLWGLGKEKWAAYGALLLCIVTRIRLESRLSWEHDLDSCKNYTPAAFTT
jgi:hypothetical protein